MKRIPILILLLTPFWLWAQNKAYNVHFPSGLHKVESNEITALEAFLQSNALPYPCLKLELSGHADADGDARANIALSERRVAAVKNALVGLGVPADNLRIAAFGEDKPVSDNESETNKAQNRRVEIKLTTASNECNPLFNGVAMQTVKFDAAKGLDYTYPVSGTHIQIPANALVDAKGRTVKGEVELKYREWRDPADFVFSGIPMQFPHNGSGDLFHSGGMYEMQAEQNGRQLNMAQGKQVAVDFALTSPGKFDFFNYGGEQWTRMDRQMTGQNGPNTGGSGQEPKRNVACLETVDWSMVEDTMGEFRKMLFEGWKLATTEAGAKTAFAGVSARKSWDSKLYMGANYVGTNPTKEVKARLYCLSLQTRKMKWGHRIEVKDASGIFTELKALIPVMMLVKNSYFSDHKAEWEGKRFCDVRVQKGAFSNGTLSLKHEKGYLSIPISLKGVPKMGQNGQKFPSKSHRENLKSVFENYSSALNKRFNQPEFGPRQAELLHAMGLPLMDSLERCMGKQAWIAYFLQNRGKMALRYTAALDKYEKDDTAAQACIAQYIANRTTRFQKGTSRPLVIQGELGTEQASTEELAAYQGLQRQSLQIIGPGFGVFNCDQIQRLPDPLIVAPVFKSGDKLVKPCNTYCLYNELNGMMQGDIPHRSAGLIYLSQRWTVAAVLVMGFDGNFYLAEPNDIKGILAGGIQKSPTVQLKDISAKATNPQQLRELLREIAS